MRRKHRVSRRFKQTEMHRQRLRMLHVTFTWHDESVLLWQIGRADTEISDIQAEILTARCKERLLTEQGRVRRNLSYLAAVGGGEAIEEVRQVFDSAKGKSGGVARAEIKYQQTTNEAYRLAREYVNSKTTKPSRRQVAIAIRGEVMSFARTINKPLTGSPESILETIYNSWLKGMPDANTLFAGKRTRSTG